MPILPLLCLYLLVRIGAKGFLLWNLHVQIGTKGFLSYNPHVRIDTKNFLSWNLHVQIGTKGFLLYNMHVQIGTAHVPDGNMRCRTQADGPFAGCLYGSHVADLA